MPRLAQRLDGEATCWLLPACQLPINAKLESKIFPNALNISNAGLRWNGDFFFLMLQQMTNTLGAIIIEQQCMNEQLQARHQASRPVRIYRTPIRHRTLTTQHELAGASVWTGDVLS